MKIKINQLNPNPFKEEINGGKLSEITIEKIRANLKEIGLMGSLPVFKKNNKYFLVAGHHRVEALKREFGKNFAVEVTVHNYSNEQALRGMTVENLTQKDSDLKDTAENLAVIRKFLQSSVQTLNNTRISKRGRIGEGQPSEPGSVRHIHDWLNKNGEVLSIGRISEVLQVHDNLDSSLLKQVQKTQAGTSEERDEALQETQAVYLARFEDKKEQKDLAKVLKDSREQRVRNQGKLITEYKNAPEEVKQKIRTKEIDIADISLAKHKFEVGDINLDRGKLDIEKHIELREAVKNLFNEKLFFQKSSTLELEKTYHYLINWIQTDLVKFLKTIETELKKRGNQEKTIFISFENEGGR